MTGNTIEYVLAIISI